MKRWYVTLTWHDWPEGGSYGDIVEAETAEEAEQIVRENMGDTLRDANDEANGLTGDDIAAEYEDQWHLVDCWDVDEFVQRNKADP